MFCTKCGNQLPDKAVFCTKCGAPQKKDIQQSVNSQSSQQNGNPLNVQQYRNDAGNQGTAVGAYPLQQPSGDIHPPINGGSQIQNAGMHTHQPPPVNPGFQPFPPGGNQGMFIPPEPEKKGSKGIVAVLIILTVIILALCGVLLYFIFSGDKSSTASSSEADSFSDSDPEEDTGASVRTTASGKKIKPITGTTAVPASQPKTQPTTAKPAGYAGIQQLAADKQPLHINYVSSDVSDYPLVKVYFTAEDNQGKTVMLSSPTAGIKETVSGGKEAEREIKSVKQLKGREGVSFDLVADKSGSMDYDLPMMQNIMSQFVDALDYQSGDKAELIAFDSYVMYMCTHTNDSQLLKNGINNMSAYGQTALYDALLEAVLNSGAQQGARCVIAFTDGDDCASTHTADEVIKRANELSVPIFIIGTVSSYDDYDRIAVNTGGQYWNINNISDMHQILDQIYEKEKDMYCIEYMSDSKEEPRKERKISIAVADETYGGISEMQFTPTEARKQQSHNSRYELITGDVDWAEANAECIKRGGHLITISSDAEMQKASEIAEAAGLSYIWIGGYTSVRGSTAYGHWITGEKFDYQKWYPGEPSRDDLDGTPEMYLMLWKVDDKGWTWNDQREGLFKDEKIARIFKGKTGYICEYES